MDRKLWVLLTFMIACCASVPIMTEKEAMTFLIQYGYLNETEVNEDGLPKTEDIKTRAITDFQDFTNIDITGVLDEATYVMMKTPRCGMPDMDSDGPIIASRKKRYALYSKWGKTALTWRLYQRTSDSSVAGKLDSILADSLSIWSEPSKITFTKKTSGSADIAVRFVTGNHGDGHSFDGKGGVLAHTFFPQPHHLAGDAHFDDAELFTDGKTTGTNLRYVAAHEFGHSLGLSHSNKYGALMAPFYPSGVTSVELSDDDIQGIQQLYGANPDFKQVSECMSAITVAFRIKDGSSYLGNGTHVERIKNNQLQSGYPKKITEEFPGIPDNIDDAFYYPNNKKTYIFKGNQYWRVTNRQKDSGYPKLISSGFRGLPNNIDAALVWNKNGKIYVMKGGEYYRMKSITSGVDNRYPRSMSAWNGLPYSIDAAFQYTDSKTYFFTGQNYYRYNDARIRPDDGFPRSVAQDWFGCTPDELLQPNTTSPSTSTTDAAVKEIATTIPLPWADADVLLTTESAAIRASSIGPVVIVLCAFLNLIKS